MDIQSMSENVQIRRGNNLKPPCAGVTSNVLPVVQNSFLTLNSRLGASTRNVLPFKEIIKKYSSTSTIKDMQYWYALHTIYSRERKACDHILSHGGTAFLPTVHRKNIINAKTTIAFFDKDTHCFRTNQVVGN